MSNRFRFLSHSEATEMYRLIEERVAWMNQHGMSGWNTTGYLDRFPLSYFVEIASMGLAYGLFNAEGRMLAAAVLLEHDDRWPEDGTAALYIHNLVSSTDVHGSGAEIISHTEEMARSMGKDFVRLDSARDNTQLTAYYESKGYKPCGTWNDGDYHGVLRQKEILRAEL